MEPGRDGLGLAVAALVDPLAVAGDRVGKFGAVGECADQGFGAGHDGLLT
jgi:hypothetical protein